MTAAESEDTSFSLLRLRVSAESDPAVLPRILAFFQNLNLHPRRVVAEYGDRDVLHVQVDVFGVTEQRMTLLAEKVAQGIHVLNAFWHYV